MTLEATEAECAEGRTAPRVSLASMEAKIVARYDVLGSDLADPERPSHPSLNILCICILVMENGFTVIGKAAPASAANFDRELGRKLAYEDAIRQLWPMEGYLLRSGLMSQERVQKLEAGIEKALVEVEDNGPKALKYVEQELRAALAK
jgi:hypothetical protein